MKKTIITFSILLTIFSKLSAQKIGFEKENFFIGGNLGGNSFVSKDTEDISFSVGTKLGYFVSKNTAVGLGIGFNSNDYFYANAFARKYYTPSNHFSLFTDLGVNYFKSEKDNIKTLGFALSVSPGISYFLNNDLAIESSIGLLSYSVGFPQFSGAAKTQNFDLDLNLKKINVGLICKF